jgi:hypothetical protein
MPVWREITVMVRFTSLTRLGDATRFCCFRPPECRLLGPTPPHFHQVEDHHMPGTSRKSCQALSVAAPSLNASQTHLPKPLQTTASMIDTVTVRTMSQKYSITDRWHASERTSHAYTEFLRNPPDGKLCQGLAALAKTKPSEKSSERRCRCFSASSQDAPSQAIIPNGSMQSVPYPLRVNAVSYLRQSITLD